LCLLALSASAQQRDPYKKWFDEDVRWIISDQERAEFLKLSTDKQRDQYVAAFWARRDPTPHTSENEFKEEHYRRLAFANIHYAESASPGWKTDRGRVYIVDGPPDKIDFHPCAASPEEPEPANEAASPSYPCEIWHYRYISGVGRDVNVRFVDVCRCGEYRREVDPSEKRQLP
jgi:GWxTD domain-containing protein